MSCARARRLLDAWVDDELDPSTHGEIDAHLAQCPACTALWHERAALREAVKAADLRMAAPPSLAADVRRALRTKSLHAPAPRSVASWWMPATTGGIGALAGALAVYIWLSHAPQENPSREAITRHVAALATADGRAERLVQIAAADRHVVKPWFQGKVDFSRLDGGGIALTIEANEAEDLLGVALERVSGAANGRTITVTLDPAEPLLFGRFDFTQTLRALVNLLENALKYSPQDTTVDVTVKREPQWLRFSVADRGTGIAVAERERVFDPFYRAPGVAPDTNGAGLGLSIARALAEAQGGSLAYEPREGGGSVFILRLPAIDVRESVPG